MDRVFVQLRYVCPLCSRADMERDVGRLGRGVCRNVLVGSAEEQANSSLDTFGNIWKISNTHHEQSGCLISNSLTGVPSRNERLEHSKLIFGVGDVWVSFEIQNVDAGYYGAEGGKGLTLREYEHECVSSLDT